MLVLLIDLWGGYGFSGDQNKVFRNILLGLRPGGCLIISQRDFDFNPDGYDQLIEFLEGKGISKDLYDAQRVR